MKCQYCKNEVYADFCTNCFEEERRKVPSKLNTVLWWIAAILTMVAVAVFMASIS